MQNKIVQFKGKKIIFLFDANVYRNIARMNRDRRIKGAGFIMEEICKRENKNNCHSIMSLTVSQELLNHLGNGDVHDAECYDALRFQYFHTHIFQKSKRIPNLDCLLNYFLLNDNSFNQRFFVSEYVFEIVEKIFLQVEISSLGKDLENIKEDFLCNRKEFHMLFKLLLEHPQNGNKSWRFYKGDSRFNKFIKNGDYAVLILEYLIRRSKYFKGDQNLHIDENKLKEFDFYFGDALLQFKYLFELLRDNGESLESFEMNEKWNAVNDFHLIFEWLFVKYLNRKNNIEVILVTEDCHKNFEGLHNRNSDVWKMQDYFNFLEFDADWGNPQKPIIWFGGDLVRPGKS